MSPRDQMAPTLRTRAPKPDPTAAHANTSKVAEPSKMKATKAKVDKTATAQVKKATPASRGSAAAKAAVASKTAVTARAASKRPLATAANTRITVKTVKARTSLQVKSAFSQTNAAVTLDHSSYPHIFDAIVNAAPYASLLALRASSAGMRERVDAILGKHLVLRAGLPPPKGAKWARMGFSAPAKTRARQYRVNVSCPGGQLPGWVCDYGHVPTHEDSCGPRCTALRERWEAVFAKAKILDFHPWDDGENRIWNIKSKFHSLQVARMYPYKSTRLHWEVPTLIVFSTFKEEDPKRWSAVSPTPTLFIDGQFVNRVVTSVLYDTARPKLSECWVNLPSLSGRFARDFVVLLFPDPDSEDTANPEWPTEHPRPNGFLWEVANFLRVGSTATYTIVGATEVPCQLVGLPRDVERTREEKEQQIVDNILAWIDDDKRSQGGLASDRAAEIRSLLKFYTRDEYRALVGEEQWKLEAVRTHPWDK